MLRSRPQLAERGHTGAAPVPAPLAGRPLRLLARTVGRYVHRDVAPLAEKTPAEFENVCRWLAVRTAEPFSFIDLT